MQTIYMTGVEDTMRFSPGMILARAATLGVLVAGFGLGLSPAALQGQTLNDVGAAQDIGNDLQAGDTGRDNPERANPDRNNPDRNDPDRNNPERANPDRETPERADDDSQANDTSDTASTTTAPRANPSNWDQWNDKHSIKRAKSSQLSWLKMLGVLLGVLVWVRTGDWINRDAQIYELNHPMWNLITLLAGLVSFFLLLFLPIVASLPVLLLAGFVPLIAYAMHHNSRVESHQKVFTVDWLQFQVAEMKRSMGMKVKEGGGGAYQMGAAVDLQARGSQEATKNKANLLTARQSPGYVLVKELVADMVKRRSQQAMLDYRQDAVSVQHFVDGVWHNGDAVERDSGDVMLAVMKQLANLKPTERKAKQVGEIGAKYQDVMYDIAIQSQGVKTGERVVVAISDPEAKDFKTYTDLGMREKIRQQWDELLAADVGMLVVSALPGSGLTTLTNVSLMETDRLMRDFFSIEDVHAPERDIENIVVHTYDSKQDQSPASILQKLIRLYPNVYVCRDLVNAESAKGLINEVKDGKLLITSTAAREAPEALLRLLQKKAPHRDLAQNVTAVLHMRLIRLLCGTCKVGYEPAPDLLKKLGIPAGKIEMLYRVPNAEEQPKPCTKCNGVGYIGRTGLFELLVVNDKVREVLLKQPKIDYLRKAARAAGMRNHQEEGILLVAKGATSLQELQRILKGD